MQPRILFHEANCVCVCVCVCACVRLYAAIKIVTVTSTRYRLSIVPCNLKLHDTKHCCRGIIGTKNHGP